MRNAFNLIMAIGMILILSGAAIMTLKYVSISSKHIADSYIKEQAEIFTQSVMEATILKIEGHDRNDSSTSVNNSAETFDGNCIKSLTFKSANEQFNANVTISKYYLYNGVDNDGVYHCNTQDLDGNISTSESHGYVMIETIVTTDQTNAKIKGTTPIRIVKRSLQRP